MNTAKPTSNRQLDRRADQIIEQTVFDGGDNTLLTTAQCATWLGGSIQYLKIGGSQGYGPPATTLSPIVVRYRKNTTLKWLIEREKAYAKAQRAKLNETMACQINQRVTAHVPPRTGAKCLKLLNCAVVPS